MYDHIGLKVGNLDASVRFYTAALAPLGIGIQMEVSAEQGPGGGMHVAPSRAETSRVPSRVRVRVRGKGSFMVTPCPEGRTHPSRACVPSTSRVPMAMQYTDRYVYCPENYGLPHFEEAPIHESSY